MNTNRRVSERERENTNDKKAQTNWKVKPFVMEYTIASVVEKAKKTDF